MKLKDRERKALLVWGGCMVIFAVVYFWPAKSTTVGFTESVPAEELRITRLRRQRAAAPGRQEILKKVNAELSKREKGLIVADTAPQAEAQLLQIVRRVAQAQQPPVVFRGTEFVAPRRFGTSYGEVGLTVTVECGIEQLVNLLADVANQPELIAVSDLQISQVNGNKKMVPARITFTGIVPRRLVPERKGGPSF